jgi:hypothetical protein
MDDRRLIDFGLCSMALDRHSAASRPDRRTMENLSGRYIGRNCGCFRWKNYCCSPKSWRHYREKDCCRPRTNYLRHR